MDINSAYLHEVRCRFFAMPGLELHCANIATEQLALAPFALVHAGLVFEHTGIEFALENALRLVAPNGCVSIVLQLPSTLEPPVGTCSRESIQKLAAGFQLIDPAELCGRLEARRFRLRSQTRMPVASGKALWMGFFERAAAPA